MNFISCKFLGKEVRIAPRGVVAVQEVEDSDGAYLLVVLGNGSKVAVSDRTLQEFMTALL